VSILAEILAAKADEIAARKDARGLVELARACSHVSPPRGFAEALRRTDDGPVRVIAEIKRASPSAGAIRAGADPVAIAREYEAGGASALSVLTDEKFFDGRLEFLGQVRDAVALPLLRKDFIIDPYQVVEARAAGADAVLLIVAALDDSTLGALREQIEGLGMDALVEVHSAEEARRAVGCGASLIGVNHRNLATFEVDTSLTGRLRGSLPEGAVVVGESGIRTSEDLIAMAEAGADAVLVGERLMRAESPGAALSELIEGARR
jgi:indole-3-glycerol phosphate synthase